MPRMLVRLFGAAHRGFVIPKQILSERSDEAAKRGEFHIEAKFEDAAQDGDLAIESIAVIRQAFTSVRQGHDQMRALKQSLV